MPLPRIDSNIANVSMDYFLRGVDAAKPQGAQAPALPGENPPAAPEEHPAGKLVTQLDVLLMKAATASTKSLDGRTVRQTFQKLVEDRALDRNSLKLLAKTADTAAKTLKALDKFTGRELAGAFGADGRLDGTTKAGKAVVAAIKAQQDLSDLFAQLGKSLHAMSRHEDQMRAADPRFRGVDAALLNEVDDMRQLCDRRATEINHLACQMKDFAVHLAANGDNADPNVAVILKTKVAELLPRQALAMHGTADALATVNEDVAGRLRPLAEKIDAFRRNPSATIGSQDFETLQGDIAAMKAAVADVRKHGIEVGGGRMMVAADVLKALEKEVAKAEDLFKTARIEVARKVLDNYLETAQSLLSVDEHVESQHSNGDQKLQLALQRRNEFLEAMNTLSEAALDPAKGAEELQALASDLARKSSRLVSAAKAAIPPAGQAAADFNAMFDRLGGAHSVAVGLVGIVSKMHGNDRFFTGAEATALFNGTLTVSSVVEARARGLRDADVDPANEDANIVAERKLGAGAAGTVFELTRTDGTSVVFKGETESRTGLSVIAAGSGGTYANHQQTVNLNIAAKKAAVALGMGDMIVNYSVGTHKGVFGFFMEKAKGMTAHSFAKGKSSSSPDAGMSLKQIKRLSPGQRLQVKADLMREMNRLQWLDLVTGQADRHWENYFIHVDPDTRKVTLKGIDNDAGYSQFRTGATTFSFDAEHTSLFKSQLKALAREIDSRNVDAVYNRLLADPGISTDAEGKKITIDASKLGDKSIIHALASVTGTQTMAIPDKIDRETYDTFMALKAGPQRDAYLASIRPRLSKESYDAAVSRLDDVIAHAEKLGRENRIIENQNGQNGWFDVDEAPRQTGKITVHKHGGQEKRLGGEIAKDVNEQLCPSYFARDGIDKLFA